MEQISDSLECNVVGVQGVEICSPANAIGIREFFEFAYSNCPQPEEENVNVGQKEMTTHTTRHERGSQEDKETREDMKSKERKKKEEEEKKKGAYEEEPI